MRINLRLNNCLCFCLVVVVTPPPAFFSQQFAAFRRGKCLMMMMMMNYAVKKRPRRAFGKRPPAPRKPKGKPGRPFVGAHGGGSQKGQMPCAFGAREEDTAPSLAMAHASRGPRMAQKARFSYVVSYRALQTSFVSGIVTSQTRQDTRAVSRDVRKTAVFSPRHESPCSKMPISVNTKK